MRDKVILLGSVTHNDARPFAAQLSETGAVPSVVDLSWHEFACRDIRHSLEADHKVPFASIACVVFDSDEFPDMRQAIQHDLDDIFDGTDCAVIDIRDPEAEVKIWQHKRIAEVLDAGITPELTAAAEAIAIRFLTCPPLQPDGEDTGQSQLAAIAIEYMQTTVSGTRARLLSEMNSAARVVPMSMLRTGKLRSLIVEDTTADSLLICIIAEFLHMMCRRNYAVAALNYHRERA